MELASPREPWTIGVAWARPWHRPVRQVCVPTSLAGEGEGSPPGSAAAIPAVTGDAWRGALLHLDAVRESRAAIEQDSDLWPAIIAQHAVHLAVERVRVLAERLELVHGHLGGP
ncbi:MAG: hypothetical protein OEW88_03625 [Gammaproteobacteria bacterium]|nr:hypothetical protein [Gammaproteobacteria bacterium]